MQIYAIYTVLNNICLVLCFFEYITTKKFIMFKESPIKAIFIRTDLKNIGTKKYC